MRTIGAVIRLEDRLGNSVEVVNQSADLVFH